MEPGTTVRERGAPAAEAPIVFEPSPLERLRARGRMRHGIALLGPAFVAAVAYVDPGNFATNIAGGAQYGYLLLWVILAANLMAMLIQYLSAKVGVATGRSLPELCREHFPRRVSFGLWIQAELIAMATDLAEFVGAAIALNLLFGVPLFASGLITAVVVLRDPRPPDARVPPVRDDDHRPAGDRPARLRLESFCTRAADASGVASGFVPGFADTESILLATGILGATVMPHVIYLHSALTQNRILPWNDGERRQLLRFERLDVGLAMGIAGLVNISMLVVAAALFHGVVDVDSIEEAHAGFESQLGTGAAVAFGVALLASGLSSSSVGTYAGQVVMQGFIRRSIPLMVRRLVTMLPALVVLAIGLDPTQVAGGQPGGAVFRHPVRARPAGAAHAPAGHHGSVRECPRHDGRGERRGRPDHRAQRVPGDQDVRGLSRCPGSLRPMPLADDFQALVDALPPDWTQLEADLRIDDEDRYIEAATLLSQVNAMPYSHHDWHWRLRSAREFGHAAAPETVRGTLALLDDQGITGDAGPARGPLRARGGHADVGPAGVGAPGVRPPPRAVAPRWRASRSSAPTCCSARSSAALSRPRAMRSWPRRDPADLQVVDLTVDADERLGEARIGELPTLAFYSHVEVDVRQKAEAAGVDRVVPRSRMARETVPLVESMLA